MVRASGLQFRQRSVVEQMKIVEERGEDFFIPAHVEPRKKIPPALVALYTTYRDLLSGWTEDCFRVDHFSLRILGRQIYIPNSPETIKHVMVTHHSNYERKSPQMRRALEDLLGDGLFISDGDTWKFRRRVVAPIIHANRMDTFAPIMVNTSADMAAHWQALGENVQVNILVEMASLTAEIISRAVFGDDLGRAKAKEVIDGFSLYQRLVDQVNIGYYLGNDEGWPQIKGPRLRWAISKVHRVVDGIIDEHMQGKGQEGSIVSTLLKVKDEITGKSMDPVAIRNEAITIFMAGHETTAATLTWAWYLLANAPWVEKRLHQEFQEVLGGRQPTLADVPKLRYTRAVIEETLRLYPPVPLQGRQARADDVVMGQKVEKGAVVTAVAWLLHRHHKHWDRPNHFIPERFYGKPRPSAHIYIPFSVGPRICTGATFGLTESILCLATLAQQFTLRVAAGEQVIPRCRLTLRPRNGIRMHVIPRD
jgi:cytochrome P450